MGMEVRKLAEASASVTHEAEQAALPLATPQESGAPPCAE